MTLVIVKLLILNVLGNNFTIRSDRVDQSIVRFIISDTRRFTQFNEIEWLLSRYPLILLYKIMGVLDYWLGNLVYKPCLIWSYWMILNIRGRMKNFVLALRWNIWLTYLFISWWIHHLVLLIHLWIQLLREGWVCRTNTCMSKRSLNYIAYLWHWWWLLLSLSDKRWCLIDKGGSAWSI